MNFDQYLAERSQKGLSAPLHEDRVLKTLKGSAIKRSKFGVGKDIGGQIYLHKNYATDVINPDLYETALEALQNRYPDFEFNCVMYDKKKPSTVRFDQAPDFDTADEPMPGQMIAYDTETGKFTERFSDQIWHHKWLWVKDDYTGFDVEKSYQWSKTWLEKITHPSGVKSKWEQALRDVGLKESSAGDVQLRKFIYVYTEKELFGIDNYHQYYDPELKGYYIEWTFTYNTLTKETDDRNLDHASMIDGLPSVLRRKFKDGYGIWGRDDYGRKSFVSSTFDGLVPNKIYQKIKDRFLKK